MNLGGPWPCTNVKKRGSSKIRESGSVMAVEIDPMPRVCPAQNGADGRGKSRKSNIFATRCAFARAAVSTSDTLRGPAQQ